jgi:hypothetical protein
MLSLRLLLLLLLLCYLPCRALGAAGKVVRHQRLAATTQQAMIKYNMLLCYVPSTFCYVPSTLLLFCRRRVPC